jgi:hypothetical protein
MRVVLCWRNEWNGMNENRWLLNKVQSHLGFIVETVVESIPQAILQMIAGTSSYCVIVSRLTHIHSFLRL